MSDKGVTHEYDGIVEEDNVLPRWWLYTLYGTIVFAFGYWIYYQALGNPGPLDHYRAARVQERRAEAARLMAMGAPTDEVLLEMAHNSGIVAQGAEIFATTCASCHLADGSGKIGPNLTDPYWLHGGAPTAILKTVRDGVVDKGMLAWGPMLGEEKVRAVTAYVLTIKDTNVPGGKAPQGDKLASIEGAPPGGAMNEPPLVQIRGSLRSDGARVAIHPADVRGRWNTRRQLVFALLILVYVALPWIPIGGHPAVFLDVVNRHFYLFGAVFNAQDTWLMLFVLGGAFVTIVLFTALLGRVWCGWACPQTVFLEGVFRRIERWIEGPREQRLRSRSWWRRGLVHVLYALTAAALAHVFLAYFVSLPGLFTMVQGPPGAHLEAFLLTFGLTAILYLDFAWFREQFCVVMCPYGRLQSVLLDQNSLVVGYDRGRGEPRGKVKDPARGACIDCKRCVVVCPTGIDIRDGLQMDCIACTACIDACDEMMDKVGQPRGLVRYDSQAALDGGKTQILRWRLALYAFVLVAGASGAAFAFGGRETLGANLLRQPGAPFFVEDGQTRNGFELHVVNKRPTAGTFRIEDVDPPAGQQLVLPIRVLTLKPLEQARVPVFVVRPAGTHAPLRLRVVDEQGGARTVTAAFLGP